MSRLTDAEIEALGMARKLFEMYFDFPKHMEEDINLLLKGYDALLCEVAALKAELRLEREDSNCLFGPGWRQALAAVGEDTEKFAHLQLTKVVGDLAIANDEIVKLKAELAEARSECIQLNSELAAWSRRAEIRRDP